MRIDTSEEALTKMFQSGQVSLIVAEFARKDRVISACNDKIEHLDLFKSVVEKFFNSADLKNQPDAESCYALAEKLKQLPDCILDFTEEQVRDNPAWALAVFRHKVKEMQYKRIHDLNAIGGEQEENARLKVEVERLTDALNKLVKTPPEATGGVRVKVDFWTQYGSRLPSSYETFWETAAKEGKPSV